MDLELKGKAAIVTGGNRGIGKAIARQLAREGVNVALIARDITALAAAAAEISRESGGKVLHMSADTGDDAAVKKAVAEVASAFGRIDIRSTAPRSPVARASPRRSARSPMSTSGPT